MNQVICIHIEKCIIRKERCDFWRLIFRIIAFECKGRSFAISFLVFCFFLSCRCFRNGLTKVFVANVSSFITQKARNQNQAYRYSIACVFMPYALEINSNGGFQWKHVESYPATTKNIIFPLLQFLWQSNLPGWWLTMREFCPQICMIL